MGVLNQSPTRRERRADYHFAVERSGDYRAWVLPRYPLSAYFQLHTPHSTLRISFCLTSDDSRLLSEKSAFPPNLPFLLPTQEVAVTRLITGSLLVGFCSVVIAMAADAPAKVAVGTPAPAYKFKDPSGKVLDLAELTTRGPVLLRLTCGCAGCDKELAYFQQIADAYKGEGLISVFVFKEPDAKVAKYAQDKKLNMIYTVDSKGESWNVFQTKTMPTNFLIEKGGKIAAIAAGCDATGLLANKVSERAAKVVGTEAVDVKSKVQNKDQK
jgi:peroxiredoxin